VDADFLAGVLGNLPGVNQEDPRIQALKKEEKEEKKEEKDEK